MKRKKWLGILLAVIMVFTMTPMMAFADDSTYFESSGVWYKIVDSDNQMVETAPIGGATPTGENYSGTISIPQTVAYNNVDYSVIGIGQSSFENSNLESIQLSEGLQYINRYAFRNSTLSSIVIPASVERLGEISTITQGNLQINVFGSSLNSITFAQESQLNTIGDYAFAETSISEIDLPDNITTVGKKAFYLCEELTSIEFPSSLITVGSELFEGCKSMESIKFNSYVDVSDDALKAIDSPELNVQFPEGSQFSIQDSVLYNGNEVRYVVNCNVEDINIKEGATIIPDEFLLRDASNLKIINLPDTITTIGERAFFGASNLTEIEFPANLESIGSYAFEGCSISEINLSGTKVNSIGDRAFSSNVNLKSINFPDTLKTMGGFVFAGCSSLDELYIPAGVDINMDACPLGALDGWFNTVKNAKVTFGDTERYSAEDGLLYDLEKNVFGVYDTSVETVVLKEGITEINGQFSQCTNLETLVLPSTLETIKSGSFPLLYFDATIIFKGDVPPVIEGSPFGFISNVSVVVPENALEAYKGSSLGEYIPSSGTGGSKSFALAIPETATVIKGETTDLEIVATIPDGAVLGVTSSDSDTATAVITEDSNLQIIAVGEGVADITVTMSLNGAELIADTVQVTVQHKHSIIKVDSKPATCTEDGNITYWYCDACKAYFRDEALKEEISKDDTVVKATGHNFEDGKCTVCGTIDSTFKPVITAGANGEWQKDSKDGLSFTSNAAFGDFQKVQVDGKDLDASNYTVKEGSTIVTLKAEYLETLSAGTHTLAIVSKTGTATTEFTIKAAATDDESSQTPDADKDDTDTPQTGDDSNMAIWFALLFVSGSALFGATAYSRKKKYSK